MTAREALERSIVGAYLDLPDGRRAQAYRGRGGAGEVVLYVERPGLGVRRASDADGIDVDAPGWQPAQPRKEIPMKDDEQEHAGSGPGETRRRPDDPGVREPGQNGEPVERSEPIDAGAGTTVVVEGDGAQAFADRLAGALSLQVLARELRDLPVRLTDTDLTAVAHRLADLIDDTEQEEADQASAKASMKEKLAGLKSEQRRLASILRRGIETRRVEVETVADYAAGLARSRRTGTLEELSTRPLTERERQLPLTPDTAAAAASAAVVHSDEGRDG